MGMPASSEGRLFYRCAYQRLEEASVLYDAGYTTGAVHLAGYCVECLLKAMILERAKNRERKRMLRSFRGAKAHDFLWLRDTYFGLAGDRFPLDRTRDFTLVSDWTTDLRYVPRFMKPAEASCFLEAVRRLAAWMDGRI